MTDQVKVTTLDNTAEYLQDKLTAGDNITITKQEAGGVESLEVAATYPTGVTTNTTNIAALDAETTPVRIKVIHGAAGSLVNKAVYVTGWDAGEGCLTVEAADNTDPTKMPAIGLVDTITDSIAGYMVTEGMYSDFDTSAYSEGDELYVDEAGALTDTYPTGSDVVQYFAIVGKVDATVGEIMVNVAHSIPSATTASQISGAAKKETAGTLAKGKVSYVTGYDATNSIGLREYAIADDAAKMPGMGIVSQEMTDSVVGRVTALGAVSGIDTDSWDVGDKLYVSATVAGELTKTRPTGESNKVQHIATCVYKHATDGIIAVVNPATFEDVPNLDSGDFWLGGATDVAESKVFEDEVVTVYEGLHTKNEVNPVGTTGTVDLADTVNHQIDLKSATGDVTLTLTNPVSGYRYKLLIYQNDVGGNINIIWPANVRWPGGTAPTISPTASDIDVVDLYYDGANYYGTFEQDFS